MPQNEILPGDMPAAITQADAHAAAIQEALDARKRDRAINDRVLWYSDDELFVAAAKEAAEDTPGLLTVLPAHGAPPGTNGPGEWWVYFVAPKGGLPAPPVGMRVVYDVPAPSAMSYIAPAPTPPAPMAAGMG